MSVLKIKAKRKIKNKTEQKDISGVEKNGSEQTKINVTSTPALLVRL